MAGIGKALKAGLKGAMEGPDGREYKVAGRKVGCTHCEGKLFQAREALLNTGGMTLLGLDWANKSGTALVCVRCFLIQWFARKPEEV